MWGTDRLVSIFVIDHGLPVPTVGIQRRENCDVAEQMDTFVHAQYRVYVSLQNSF